MRRLIMKGIGCGLPVGSALLILLAALVFGGAVYEGQAQAEAKRRFPAPGQLVEVDGRTMHIQCRGEGSPTIILDAGQGGWSSDWADIMPELSEENRVCAYDRAGYGWSEASGDSRSPVEASNDLAALLAAAQIEPPYVLVGFSHAGLANRIFAAQHAEQMAGMVLVDPATEFDHEILGPALLQQQRAAVNLFQGFGFAARFGLVRLLGTENMAGSAPFIATNPPEPELYYTFVAEPQWWNTSVREFASGLDEEHMVTVREQGAIGDMPLVIIASDVLGAADDAAMEAVQAGRHEALRALAAQSAQGEFLIAEGSTHNVLADRPDVVLSAIARVLSARG